MQSSRPASVAFQETASNCSNLPTLADILSNSAPPPWTLAAFMRYLSQNHCLETLEFTLDAGRYKAAFQQEGSGGLRENCHQLCSLWQRLIMAYVIPFAPREVNLPAPVRDRLLAQGCRDDPPEPSTLDEAVAIVYDLMSDSVLRPFLESFSKREEVKTPMSAEPRYAPRKGRSQSHAELRAIKVSRSVDHSRSPRASFLPLNLGRHGAGSRSASLSSEPHDRDAGSDDSCGSLGSANLSEPMTPPTTPSTSRVGSVGSSPSSIHRALNAHGGGWRKVGARLGFGKMPLKRNSVRHASSDPPDDSSTTSHGDF